ncbi:sensor histidine kinase [Candidatus Symbiobacter mobilis]|uniref:histidine kinase n=1 Tax=Candidatus Symbiobacter mobilis CR TaxID=946483 RepID=U5N913_9BURK|nr:ATP-binding protein [Candidatus Symbiobacter mobilis]AGX86753.1 histidine kinase-like protein [Candidatus Symbiobacter mobilis CR]
MNTSTHPPGVLAREVALQRELELARAELQEFTYTVSHDLRAPVRHILAYIQVIAEDFPDLPAEVLSHLQVVSQSAHTLGEQIEGLTRLSRLGTHPLRLQAVDAIALAREVAAQLDATRREGAVEWAFPPDAPAVVADPELLRQLWAHLLGNAWKFTRGKALATIRIDCRRIDGECPLVELGIRDNGVGFASNQAAALGKVFGRLHSKRDFEGLGLGLVSVRRILDRMGGTLAIEGTVNQGCCATVRLPTVV